MIAQTEIGNKSDRRKKENIMAEDLLKYFIFRDKRLKGKLSYASLAILSELDEDTSVTTAFGRLYLQAKNQGKINTLFILCHGYVNDFDQGGLGLELGKEDLTINNVIKWAALKELVDTIVVCACSAAYTGHSMLQPWIVQDGQALMSSLSKITGATVYAADRLQTYFTNDFNFGKWEGTVYTFWPDGKTYAGALPETEIIDVISPMPYGTYYGDVIDRRNR